VAAILIRRLQEKPRVSREGDDLPFIVNTSRCYNMIDTRYVGHVLDEMKAYWFEEPVAREDHDGDRELRANPDKS
jgi:D-galactarolactone cycloisomerase